MAASGAKSFLALRGEEGVWLMDGPQDPQLISSFPGSCAPKSRILAFSANGRLLAYNEGAVVRVVSVTDMRLLHEIRCPRAGGAQFSPKGTVLALWEPYIITKDIPAGTPNMGIYCMQTGQLLKAFMQKKQQGWFPQWSEDEGICARNVNNELHFFENNNFETIQNKLHLQKVAEFQLPPKGGAPYYVAAYVPGAKGQPCFVRIYQYPSFGSPIANKSFYKADRVNIIWNNRSTALLLLTATDTSAESYYGEQGLHFMGVNGDTCLVPRSKNGPVYSVAWNPKSTNFCVVYGFMPAKATLFNLKSEPVFDYGTGPRNECWFNPHGNLLCLAGFGNLNGNVEFWDVKNKVLMSNLRVPDSTQFEWAPDGQHCVTATTSPRLRVGNGFKIWHYLGNVLHEENTTAGKELWQVMWQPAPEGTFPEPRLTGRPAQPVQPSEMPGGSTASLANVKEGTYVPPHLRNKTGAAARTASGPKFREEYEPASNVKQGQAEENMSKQALKNKKKREAKKAKAQQEQQAAVATPTPQTQSVPSTGDPEKDKQIKTIKKKLQAIDKLKAKQAAGEKLELNQLEKLKTEDTLIEELEALTL